MTILRPATAHADRIALPILAAVAITAALAFRNYGLGWADYTQLQYGSGFDMAAALADKVPPYGLFETRRGWSAPWPASSASSPPRRRDLRPYRHPA